MIDSDGEAQAAFNDRAEAEQHDEGERMTTNRTLYKKLRETLREWREVGTTNQHIASTQIGVISGGIDLSEEWADQEQLRKRARSLTRQLIDQGARLSRVAECHEEAFNDHGGADLVQAELDAQEAAKAWATEPS